jgi:hypothetical protein
MGNFGQIQDVDTTKFREAVWDYAFICTGYKREMHNKKSLEKYLKPGLKKFIKKAVFNS